MSAPGFLAVGGVEIANNARTVAYMQRGLGGPWFQAVQATACPDLTLEAWPLTTCPAVAGTQIDQLYTSPIPTWRAPNTGAVPSAAQAAWNASGVVGVLGAGGPTSGAILPNIGVVNARYRLALDLLAIPAATRNLAIGRVINPGTANVAWIGPQLTIDNTGLCTISVARLLVGGGGNVSSLVSGSITFTGPTAFWFEAVFTPQAFVATVYGTDPDVPGASVLFAASYGYVSAGPGSSLWASAAGVSELESMATATDTALSGTLGSALFPMTELVISEIDVAPGLPCIATGHLYPSDSLWPADDLYPDMYGEFHDPGTDNAPWVDIDRPEGYGFLGLLVDDIEGLDITSTRSMDPSSTGIGGILGPEQLQPRKITVKGWMIASDCSAMEYARRWLGDVLAGSLCANCDTSFIDVRTTCGDDPLGDFYTNRWRIYDVGLTNLVADTSDQEACCFVTPITIEFGAEDPYLYGPVRDAVAATKLNDDGPDVPLIPFESWLFAPETAVCTTLVDPGVGEDAPIFTFSGGTSGIEGGVVYPGLGVYPADSIWPSDCLYPADGLQQWDMLDCPTALTFSIGPGETFQVDNARRRIVWVLADGTVLDGSPKLNLPAGDTVQFIETCSGADLQACAVAVASCTCDDTATVTIQTQHRER